MAIADVPSPASPEVQLKAGATLGSVAAKAYGHEEFSGFMAAINAIADPAKIPTDTTLKTPSLALAFQQSGADPIYQPAINALAKASTDYFAALPAFQGARSGSYEDGVIIIPSGVKTAFIQSADSIEAAVAVLESARPPHSVPQKSIEQFRAASTHLRKLARAELDLNDYKYDVVGQRLGLGFTNLMIWTRQQHR